MVGPARWVRNHPRRATGNSGHQDRSDATSYREHLGAATYGSPMSAWERCCSPQAGVWTGATETLAVTRRRFLRSAGSRAPRAAEEPTDDVDEPTRRRGSADRAVYLRW